MALLHQATIQPTKLELLAAWLPGRPWSRVPEGAVLQRVAGCRFDDPAGAVGVEILLVRVGDGPVHHTPLTYRDAPLAGAEAWLVAPLFWLIMLAWSKPWLDRFRYGPFEWAWRSLARWSPQPMRRDPKVSGAAGAAET